jgi:predicted ribosome quality control (RQC) complex YloA/Tae2 family protein
VTFLRAHIRGGRITSATQIGSERIVRIAITKSDREYLLWIRLWANASNILMTDSGHRILDVLYRRPKRREVSGARFEPPPRDGKGESRDYTVRELEGPGSFNERLERHFFELEKRQERESLRTRILRDLEKRENHTLLRLQQLEEKREDYSQAERWREIGDLIKSSIHRIGQGDRWLKTEDFYNRNKLIEIEIDPRLSPVQNSEVFYRKAKRAKQRLARLDQEATTLNRTLSRLRDKRERISREHDLTALRSQSPKPSKERKQSEPIPGLVYDTKGFRIMVGRTSAENDRLLRSFVNGNDYWFHCRDYPGAYVFVKLMDRKKGASLPLEPMLDAANLALFHSKGKSSGQGDIYYTQVKYLRRIKGGRTGLVTPTQEKNLFIYMDPVRIEGLKRREG